MKMFLKKVIQKFLALFNLRLQFIRDYSTTSTLSHLNIGMVIDVGANTGQFGREIREKGFDGEIYSFEPLTSAHAELLRLTAKDLNWKVHPRCAVGNFNGEIEIHIAGNSYSSSIRQMLPAHSNAAPDSVSVGIEQTRVIMIDNLIDKWMDFKGNIYLKIDTQGFEAEVLQGAKLTLEQVVAVQLELSIVELYKGQALYDYFFDFFRDRGFMLFQLIPGFLNPQNGQLLQFDAVFIRQEEST